MKHDWSKTTSRGIAACALLLFLSLSTFAQSGTEGYYKDLFIDGGVYLAAGGQKEADSLGLVYEHIMTENALEQNYVMVSNSIDANGALLYPDGSPRFRMLYTNGGYGNHGATLGWVGRKQIYTFYVNGGSYVGSCNGAALATAGSDTYGLWVGQTLATGIGDVNSSSPTTHNIPSNSPVRNYYSLSLIHI